MARTRLSLIQRRDQTSAVEVWEEEDGSIVTYQDGKPLVAAGIDPITGGIEISANGVVASASDFLEPHIAKAISYVGDGAVRQLDFGFRPDLVIIKGAGRPAVIYNAEQWYGNVQSFGHTTYSGSDAQPVPAINDSGVALMYNSLSAAKNAYNEAGVLYHAVGIRDNGADFLRTFAYNGFRSQTTAANGANSDPVDMTALTGLSPKWVHIKRDAVGAGHEGVWASSDGYVKKESSAAVNSALLTYKDAGTLALSTDAAVNENNGSIVGEAHNCFALLENPKCWAESSYIGGGGSVLSFKRRIAVAVILPVAAEEMVFSTPTMGAGATGGATALVSGISVSGAALNIAGMIANTPGVTYRVIVIFEGSAHEKFDKWPQLIGVQLQSGAGRIVCGTDASLQIAGAHSLEWVGAISDYVVEQFIVGRMNGGRAAPTAGTYDFAIAHTRDPDAGLEICVSDRFSSETTDISKQQRWRTGIVLTPFRKYHILVTHDGIDKWCLYIDGRLVKWRRLPMSVFGLPGITGTAGLTMVFGARLAAGTYYANTATVHALGRIYNRELTAAESRQMFKRNALQQLVPTQIHTDISDTTTALIEEWRFREGSGTSVAASKTAANNGTITSGSWVKF